MQKKMFFILLFILFSLRNAAVGAAKAVDDLVDLYPQYVFKHSIKFQGIKNNFDYFKSRNSINFNAYLELLAANQNGNKLKNVTQPCLSELMNIMYAAIKNEDWAFRVFDSYGRPQSGLLEGSSLIWLGEYSQCVNIKLSNFRGKYCSLSTSIDKFIPDSTHLIYGLCVPDVCKNTDIAQLVNFAIEYAAQDIENLLPIPISRINSSVIMCQEKRKIDWLTILTLIIISIIIFTVLTATFYDFHIYERRLTRKLVAMTIELNNHDEKETCRKDIKHKYADAIPLSLKVLRTLSIYRNIKNLFKVTYDEDQLLCLHGIKSISLAWIILAHTYSLSRFFGGNSHVFYEWSQKFSYQFILNASFAADTFFLISGLLTSYNFLKELSKPNGKITFRFMIKYYIHRLWRIIPTYFIVLMVEVTLSKYFGDGPLYPKNGFEKNMCRNTWWKNVLFINNLVYPEDQCFEVSWFIANSVQFHLIAPIFLIPLAYNKRILATIISTVFIFAAILSTGLTLDAHRGSEAGYFGTRPYIFGNYVHYAPWVRVSPFVIGIALGYLIHSQKIKTINTKLPRLVNNLFWLVSILVCAILVFGTYQEARGKSIARVGHILYQCFSRPLWALSVGFIIFSCVSGYGGTSSRILEWLVWIPLSRLNYSTYLAHVPVLLYFYFSMQHPVYFQHQTIRHFFISNWILSYAVGLVVYIFFEIPFQAIENYIFKWYD